MAMSLKERMQRWKLLRRNYTSCNQASPGNIAIFFDEHHLMAHAGVVIKWPLIKWTDSESGIVDRMDGLWPPLVGTKVRFYSRIANEESKPAEEPQPAVCSQM